MTDRSEDPRFALYRRNLDVLARALADRDARIAELEGGSEAAGPEAAGASPGRRRAAILCPDPASARAARSSGLRAALAVAWDTDTVAPVWEEAEAETFGTAPGQRALVSDSFAGFQTLALALALEAAYDLVVVRGARLPALLLAALIRKAALCPVILDLDETDLAPGSGVAVFEDLSDDALVARLAAPGGAVEILCRSAPGEIATRTAAHPGLAAGLDAFLVRPAPAGGDFDPARVDRGTVRAALGLDETDFAVLVPCEGRAALDTARAAADVTFLLPDAADTSEDANGPARIVTGPAELPGEAPLALAAADAVLLTAPGTGASFAPLLARISEAAAFGLPVLTDALPALDDLARLGLVRPGARADLPGRLAALIAERDAGAPRAAAPPAAYRTELGPDVNAARLQLAVEAARAEPLAPGLLEGLVARCERAWTALARPTSPPVAAGTETQSGATDIVMFWKQNDSGLYGRRADMLMKYLLASGRIGRILQFDAPAPVHKTARRAGRALGPAGQHDAMILGNVIADQYRLRDRPRHLFRTFLWSRDAAERRLLPGVASSDLDFPAFVAAQIAAAGISAEDALGWVYPAVPGFPEAVAGIRFRGLVGDLVDDQRTMDLPAEELAEVARNYDETLPRLDLALTNCDAMAAAFAPLCPAIHVVPNGAELPPQDLAPHPALARYPGPIAGYIGNLGDRIDWDLLTETARLLPAVSFVIVGGGQSAATQARADELPNLHLHGAVPYAEAQAAIRGFDVALMPHVQSAQTARMNPLKIYNYAAVGRPVVATPVANIDPGLAPHIRFAETPESFAAAIGETLAAPPPPGAATLQGLTWESRTKTILALLDTAGLLPPGEV